MKAASAAAKDRSERAAKVLAALRAKSSPIRRRVVELFVGFALARPLREFVDRRGLLRLVTTELRPEALAAVVRGRGGSVWRRHVARTRGRRTSLGAALSAETRARLREIVAETPPPPGRWTRDAVDPALIRRLVAPVVQEMLVAFVQRLPGAGFAGGEGSWPGRGIAAALGSRVREEIGRRAGQVAEAGRAVLGGLGIDVDSELGRITREFSETAERDFRDALARRIATPEGRALLADIQTQVLERLLRVTFEELHEDVESLPWSDLVEVAVPVFRDLRRQAFFVRALGEEIEAWLGADGERPLAELFDEVGVLAAVKKHVVARGDRLAAAFVSSAEFERWLSDLLALA